MASENSAALNISRICRLCIREHDNLSPIFDTVLPLRITECVSLEVATGDMKPTQICVHCLNQINTWFSFKQLCIQSDQILTKYISARNEIPVEPIAVVDVKDEAKPFTWDDASENDEDDDGYNNYYSDVLDDKPEEKYFDVNTPQGYPSDVRPSSSAAGFPCKPCNVTFEESVFLTNHNRVMHPGNDERSCFYCGEVAATGIALIQHERTHREKPRRKLPSRKPAKRKWSKRRKDSSSDTEDSSGESEEDDEGEEENKPVKEDVVGPVINKKGAQVCLVCGKKFLCMAVLVTHERRVHLGEPVFQCVECRKCYTTKRTLTTHMGSHQPDKHHPCDVCGKAFTHKTLMSQHKVLVHSAVKPYKCPLCAKSFVRRYMLKTHQVVHTKEKAFNCEFCHKNFSRRESLKVHLRCHSAQPAVKYVPPRRYMCTLCGKDYISPGELNRHELVTHKGERPFKCDQCDKAYASKFSLQVHQAIHQSERNHICELCGKCFNHGTRLSQHKSLVHHAGKPFKCFICGKCFLKPSLLKKHQVVHTGERFEKCAKCEKTFGTREGLKQHWKTHAEVKRFSCATCGKRFAVNKSLKAHKCDGRPFVDKEKSVGCPTCGKMFISKKTLGRHMTLQRCTAVH